MKIRNRFQLIEAIESLIKEKGPSVDLNHLDVSDISYFDELFEGDIRGSFVGNIARWDVSRAESFKGMFGGSKFNGDLSQWKTGRVRDMQKMFYGSWFNQDISGWDVSKVVGFETMFRGSVFDQDLSAWDVSSARHMDEMFALSRFTNKGKSLESWKPKELMTAQRMFWRSRFNQRLSAELFLHLEKAWEMFQESEYSQSLSHAQVPYLRQAEFMFAGSKIKDLPEGWNIDYIKEHPEHFEGLFYATPYLLESDFEAVRIKFSEEKRPAVWSEDWFDQKVLPEWIAQLTQKHLNNRLSLSEGPTEKSNKIRL